MTYRTLHGDTQATFPSGMVRDTADGKARFDLLLAEGVPYAHQFLTRCADLMARGAVHYGDRNWEQADSAAELGRMRSSAIRHLMQWACGDTDEDHAAATVVNLLFHEMTVWKINAEEAQR